MEDDKLNGFRIDIESHGINRYYIVKCADGWLCYKPDGTGGAHYSNGEVDRAFSYSRWKRIYPEREKRISRMVS